METKQTKEALRRVSAFDKVEVATSDLLDVLQDRSVIDSVLDRRKEPPLVEYPEGAGKFFGRELDRDCLVAFMGPEKRGKTFWLLDVAWRAMLQRRRVLVFEVGDMSRDQVLSRFYVRAAKHPLEACKVKVPKKVDPEQEGEDVVELVEKEFKATLTRKAVEASLDKVMLESVRSKDPYLKLSVHPNDSIGAAGILQKVRELERKGWVPDVVVIDYADLLSPPAGYTESRDAINSTWKKLRALSQEYHCLVVTATQANAASYLSDSLDMSNFSEDKRKFAHVTAMVGLNQNNTEKKIQLMRLNWLVRREEEYLTSRYCYVAGCLKLANPAMRSVF